jgi:hypothetical protein
LLARTDWEKWSIAVILIWSQFTIFVKMRLLINRCCERTPAMKFVAAAILCHAGATLLAGCEQGINPTASFETIGQAFCYLGLLALTTLVITDLSKKPSPPDDEAV